jgi:leucyl aminopeptidase
MTLDIEAATLDRLPDDLVALGLAVLAGDDGPRFPTPLPLELAVHGIPEPLDPTWCKRQGFSAKVGQALVLRPGVGPAIVLLGLGPHPGDDDAVDHWRRAGAALVRATGEGGTAAFVLPAGLDAPARGAAAAAIVEGALMAGYRLEGFRSTRPPAGLDRLVVADAGPPGPLADGVTRGRVVGQAVCTARDLINTPPSDLTPTALAARAHELLAGLPGISVTEWDDADLARERMGAVLGVSRGSAEAPRFIRVDYEPVDPLDVAGRVPHVVLVGKGITFDSGGLSLKTSQGMMTMKTDMSGAACVLSTVAACGPLGVRVRVTALAPLTENMPGGAALKPGDVLTTRNGLTIEVLDTDAEGRLVLADALALAAELEPDAIVDVATLTGAVTHALGTLVAAVLGNDDSLIGRVRRAGAAAGEQLWQLPLTEEYRDHLDSEVADMKNIGRGQAGTIVAALLLQRFVGEVPWAHLDIAGTGRATDATGYLTKGGTGFGVRTLLELLRAYGTS